MHFKACMFSAPRFQNPSLVWRQGIRDTQIQVLVLFSSSVTSSKHEPLWSSGQSFVTKMTPNSSISMPCFCPVNLTITSIFPFIVPSPDPQVPGSISFLDLSGAQWTSNQHCILTSQWLQPLVLIRTESSRRGTRPAADQLSWDEGSRARERKLVHPRQDSTCPQALLSTHDCRLVCWWK